MPALIGIDPGHGETTPGKRSPASLGQPILREYEFNRSVAWALEQALNRCGISHMRTVTDNSDPGLIERARRAKEAGCRLLVSCHANAGGGTGIETFYYDRSGNGARLARLVQESIVAATGMRDRGTKTKIAGNRNSGLLVNAHNLSMTGCLVECGFMDSAGDLAKLRTHEHKIACGEGICRGVCLYLGVPYVAPPA